MIDVDQSVERGRTLHENLLGFKINRVSHKVVRYIYKRHEVLPHCKYFPNMSIDIILICLKLFLYLRETLFKLTPFS